MREYKEVERTRTERDLVKTVCDLCGRAAVRGNWSSSNWAVNEVEVEVHVHQKDGFSYPEGGNGNEYTVDLCPSCFRDELIPWLKSKGAKIEQADWDW